MSGEGKENGNEDLQKQLEKLKEQNEKMAEDMKKIQGHNETLFQEVKDAKAARDQAIEQLEKRAEDEANKEGDIDAINASWQKKYDKLKSDSETKVSDLTSMLEREKVHSKAVELSSTLAVPGSADVLLPHIERRLRMEIRDGKPETVVLNSDGKPSALTVDELSTEISSDKRFAPLIVGSNASGGGANGSGGGAVKSKTTTRSEFDAMSHAQRSEFAKEGGKVVDD